MAVFVAVERELEGSPVGLYDRAFHTVGGDGLCLRGEDEKTDEEKEKMFHGRRHLGLGGQLEDREAMRIADRGVKPVGRLPAVCVFFSSVQWGVCGRMGGFR